MIADVVVDLQYGDCGKGKVTHYLCKTNDYTHVIRYNGGCNAGHTIYHDGRKVITHHIPAGVFFGVKSIIGPGCVIYPDQFFSELVELEKVGIETRGLVYIAKNAHVITRSHLREDSTDTSIGTTKRGNGPAYRDKYARTGVRAENVEALQDYIVDIYDELHNGDQDVRILFEGAQGFGLDVDWGDYPFVTSSHCTSASALLNGVPPQSIRNIYGVAKMYETYVGAKRFEPKDPIFEEIRTQGEEFGATTGRPRQCNWMNWQLLEKAIRINGVTDLVFNKVDVLEGVGQWSIYDNDIKKDFQTSNAMREWLTTRTQNLGVKNINFSGNKERI
jgi:adenylosuccinate synthase